MIEEKEKIDYITAPGISYSALSRLSKGPKAYINKDSPSGDFLSVGSAVDILLTEEDTFHDLFYVMTAKKPSSDMMLKYVETMIATDDPAQALAASGYKKALSDAKWQTDGLPYYEAIKASEGKTVLSFEQYQQVQAVVNQLKTNTYTAKYFDSGHRPEHVEVMYQFVHYFDYKGKPGKVKLDLLVIDHKEKTISPLDLKTTGKSVFTFTTSYKSYKYYLQGAWFVLGVKDWADKNYPEYSITGFDFIVAEMAAYNPPLIFEMSKEEIKMAIVGGKSLMGYPIKGVDQLLEDLDYYERTNKWEYPAEIDKSFGRVILNTIN
jgi:hypothetical protein